MKILLIGPGDSPHFVYALRNIRYIYNEADIYFYSSAPFPTNLNVVKFCKIIEKPQISINPIAYWPLNIKGLSTNYSGDYKKIYEFINKEKPDYIHFFCFQDAGYLLDLAISENIGYKPRIIGTCYGNDLFYYRANEAHKPRLESILSKMDVLITDNYKDLAIARSLGFSKRIEHVPLSSMLTKSQMYETFKSYQITPKNWCERDSILIKSGNAMRSNSTQILRKYKELARTFDVKKIHMVSYEQTDTHLLFELKKLAPGLLHMHNFVGNDRLCQLISESKAVISLNMSDGVPHFLFEACYFGSYPIFSKFSGLGIFEEIGCISLIDPNSEEQVDAVLQRINSGEIDPEVATNINLSLFSLLEDKIVIDTIKRLYN